CSSPPVSAPIPARPCISRPRRRMISNTRIPAINTRRIATTRSSTIIWRGAPPRSPTPTPSQARRSGSRPGPPPPLPRPPHRGHRLDFEQSARKPAFPGKRPEHALDQCGIAIFLDLFDPAVLDPPHHAIVIVVTDARLGDVVAFRLDHDIVALGDEIERHGAW